MHERFFRAAMLSCIIIFFFLASCAGPQRSLSAGLPVIRPNVKTQLANGGWRYDRYSELDSLDAGRRIVVADLAGPGIIRHIHTTRHFPEELFSRGIVLEIWFDDAEQPAVMSPLADFFGDGCNGNGSDFTSNLIECAPWSYNCYIPMPFKQRARVILRNDTDKDAMNYSFVEWETLPAWDEKLGYFHATYARRCFQLGPESDVTFLELRGAGHILGRQYSVATDEPWFRGFNCVMEGNNEIDIDGRARQLDYLGTEDSFTFSWGFREPFAGQHAGMRLAQLGDVNLLSIYRFHDAMPLRFNESLRWHINWSQEHSFTQNPDWAAAVAEDGGWVDYATVHYWYQDAAGGFQHAPLRPVAERRQTLLRSSCKTIDSEQPLAALPVDPDLANLFSTADDLNRVLILGSYPDTHPFWIDQPQPQGGHPGQPNPGRQGILAVHAQSRRAACCVIRKVALPQAESLTLEVVVSGDPYEFPGKSDFRLQAGIHDGESTTWLPEEVIDAGDSPAAENWRALRYNVTKFAGKTVGIVVKLSGGGPKRAWLNEEAFLDEISVRVE